MPVSHVCCDNTTDDCFAQYALVTTTVAANAKTSAQSCGMLDATVVCGRCGSVVVVVVVAVAGATTAVDTVLCHQRNVFFLFIIINIIAIASFTRSIDRHSHRYHHLHNHYHRRYHHHHHPQHDSIVLHLHLHHHHHIVVTT